MIPLLNSTKHLTEIKLMFPVRVRFSVRINGSWCLLVSNMTQIITVQPTFCRTLAHSNRNIGMNWS